MRNSPSPKVAENRPRTNRERFQSFTVLEYFSQNKERESENSEEPHCQFLHFWGF